MTQGEIARVEKAAELLLARRTRAYAIKYLWRDDAETWRCIAANGSVWIFPNSNGYIHSYFKDNPEGACAWVLGMLSSRDRDKLDLIFDYFNRLNPLDMHFELVYTPEDRRAKWHVIADYAL